MKIDSNQIETKVKVGHDGICPIFRLGLKGGRQLVIAVRNGQADPLCVGAPHKAVAMHVAKQRCPTATWTELSKSDELADPSTVAQYVALTDLFRRANGY